MRHCAYCGSETANPKFCNSKCRAGEQQRLVVEQWRNGTLGHSHSTRLPPAVRTEILESQNGTCAICLTLPIWNGQPLTLVLDHVNGDSSDDSPENVRLVCPNCDSQLPTYKSKNKGNGRHYRRQRYASGQSY